MMVNVGVGSYWNFLKVIKGKKNLVFAKFILLALVGFLIQCKGPANETTESSGIDESKKPLIVCTTGMIADGVKNIVGDRMEVHALMGTGVDPHLYKASQTDLQWLTKADLVVYNGLHLEGKMTEILEKLGRQKKVKAITQGIDEEVFRLLDAEAGTYDPHVWFDVALWKKCLETLVPTIQSLDETNKTVYQKQFVSYASQLDSLDQWVKSEINTIPTGSRVLITAHDAFGYFGRAYGIEVLGLQGISTLSEFGLRDITNLVDLIVSRKIKAVFVESSVPQRSIEAVMEGCEKKGFKVNLGGTLYSDAMGDPSTPEGTYIGMVKANVGVISQALK